MMKNWKEKYVYETAGRCWPEAIVSGNTWRISVLTPSLLRLEYSEDGNFEDRATQTVINRQFPVPQFSVKQENSLTVIETETLKICYDGQPFSMEGLMIVVKEMEGAVWHYGQEVHDLKGTYRTLDRCDGSKYNSKEETKEKIKAEIKLGPGVISREGFSVIDDSRSMAMTEDCWVEPRTDAIDLYFFGYGHRYLEAINDFYHLCGKTPLLPRYALGNWWSRYFRYTEESYKKLMTRFRQEELPFTVAVIDMDWHLVDDVNPKYGSGWTGYTWNRKFFPEPETFLSWLHEQGMKVTLNVHPADGIRAFEDIYPKVAEAMGIDPASEQAVAFDAADPEFLNVYFDIVCRDLEKQGVDFWWIDWQQGKTTKVPGLDPLWVLNHYHYLDSKQRGERPMTFSRYAEVGSHRYPVGFSGDTWITWESLDYQPQFTNTASNIGYGWWSHDIGGHFHGFRDDELMARWIQYGVFSPINRLHSSKNPFSGKEPWRYNTVTRTVMNRYLRLRHSMIPYLYTMNRRASRENLPLIQPMYYLEPEREETYQVPNEYYFGTELLVSPITEKVDGVSCRARAKTWLPEGVWADFFTGAVYTGGKMVELWRTVEDMPVLMKAGAIVPLRNTAETDNSVDNPRNMELRIFPAADGQFTLWEDAGNTVEDQDENWAATKVTVDRKHHRAVIGAAEGNLSVLPESRSWKLVFTATKEAKVKVYADGEPVNVAVSWDEEIHSLTVEIPEISVQKEIAAEFEGEIQIEGVPLAERIFAILEDAQMDYEFKHGIYIEVTDRPETFEQYLRETEMDQRIKACMMAEL